MHLESHRFTACLALIALSTAIANAQSNEQTKLLARRAAEADAYRKLAETIKGIEITSDTFVRDFVTESDTIEAELDDFIKGVRLGDATYYDDGTCEVRAEVTVAKLVQELKEIHSTHYRGGRLTTNDITSIKNRLERNVIQVTGMGAPRSELPPEMPSGVETSLSQSPPMLRSSTYPPIWRSISPQGRLMAAEAARRDAQRKLLERILGVRVNSNTLVRDFVTESDEISTHAEGLVIGSNEIDRYFRDNELIVEVTMAVPTEQVVRTIKEIHSTHYNGNRVTGSDIVKISESIQRKTFEATGSGVPPAKYRNQSSETESYAVPDWMATRITVTGYGTDPQIDTPQGKLKAFRAATADARRKLLEEVSGLRLSRENLVGEYLGRHYEVRTQLQGMIAGAIIERRTMESRKAAVTASVGGPDVWRIISAQLTIETKR